MISPPRGAADRSMRPSDAEGVPELHEVAIPDKLRQQIEKAMTRYPQLRSASIPALWAVQRHYGWCSPGGHPPGRRRDGRHAGLPAVGRGFYDLFETCGRSAGTRSWSAPTSPAG